MRAVSGTSSTGSWAATGPLRGHCAGRDFAFSGVVFDLFFGSSQIAQELPGQFESVKARCSGQGSYPSYNNGIEQFVYHQLHRVEQFTVYRYLSVSMTLSVNVPPIPVVAFSMTPGPQAEG